MVSLTTEFSLTTELLTDYRSFHLLPKFSLTTEGAREARKPLGAREERWLPDALQG